MDDAKGPTMGKQSTTDARTLAECRRLMRGGSRSFFAASLLLPARYRDSATALYAFCRVADDAIDLSSDPASALVLLRRRLDAIYAGTPGADPADRALAVVVRRCGLPRALLDGLLEGFAWDAEGRRYDTLAELEDYAARVAGTVGAMMALVMETQDATALARACELGVAMQLTNIARDVGEDARNGRLYLPRQWMLEAGLEPEGWLADPQPSPTLDGLVRRLLARADALYARAECGVAALPHRCRPAIQAARLVYAAIGREVLERPGRTMVHRAVVPGRTKLGLMLRALPAALLPPGHPLDAGAAAPALPAVRGYVDAAARAELPRRTYYQRAVRVLALTEQARRRTSGAEPWPNTASSS
jgi:phytoene synthase